MTIGIPFGTSLLGTTAGIRYTDTVDEDGSTVRSLLNPSGKYVAWKSESGDIGPIWIDGIPLGEWRDGDSPHWHTNFYARKIAQDLATRLGATFEEV